MPLGVKIVGVVHSHPPGIARPSGGDLIYARDILDKLEELPYLLLPIIESAADTGRFSLHPYAITRANGDVRIEPLVLTKVRPEPMKLSEPAIDTTPAEITTIHIVTPLETSPVSAHVAEPPTHEPPVVDKPATPGPVVTPTSIPRGPQSYNPSCSPTRRSGFRLAPSGMVLVSLLALLLWIGIRHQADRRTHVER